MARGSAGLCFKSKCRAFTRVEISFDCSMQTGDVIEVKTGGNFGFLRNRSLFCSNSSELLRHQSPTPKFQQRSETEFLIIALGTVTVGLSRCPIDFQIWRPGSPPRNPPSPPLLLGDASLVTALYKLSPGGRGAARFTSGDNHSINLFLHIGMVVPSI